MMSRWRTVGAVAVIGLAADPVVAQTVTVLTETQALERMRSEYPQASALRFGVQEVDAGGRERSITPNPVVSYTREDAGLGVDDFLLVTQELPFRGRPALLGEAAGRATAAAAAAAEARSVSLAAALRLVFTGLLVAQERIGILADEAEILDRLVGVLREREAVGEGSRFDRLRAERESAEVEVERGAAEIARVQAQARLAAFFGPATDPAGLRAAGSLTSLRELPPLARLLDRALEQRADYRALGLAEARWDLERRAAARLGYPATTVSAGLKRTSLDRQRSSGYAVTANVALPLFNRGQWQVARAEAARARSAADRELLRAGITRQVRVAYVTASRYRALADRYRARSLEIADALLAMADAAYEEGEYGILALLDAHRVVRDARLRQLQLVATARRAAIDLEAAVGGEPQR